MNDRDEESDPMLGKIPNEINEGEAAANILYWPQASLYIRPIGRAITAQNRSKPTCVFPNILKSPAFACWAGQSQEEDGTAKSLHSWRFPKHSRAYFCLLNYSKQRGGRYRQELFFWGPKLRHQTSGSSSPIFNLEWLPIDCKTEMSFYYENTITVNPSDEVSRIKQKHLIPRWHFCICSDVE